MNITSALRQCAKRLAGRVNQRGKQVWYLCFIPVLRITRDDARTQWRLFGIPICKKSAIPEIREKIMASYAELQDSPLPRHYLLFDNLEDAEAEAIDSWAMFLYLREQGVPARYVLRKDNRLAQQQHPWQEDISLVDNQMDFLLNGHELIAGACCIISSFGLNPRYDNMLRQLPFLQHVFIEHGVTFLKASTLSLYNPERFSHILAPCRLTLAMHAELGLWDTNHILCHGMPRWDLLERQPHEGRNIFVFFTWRSTFVKQPEHSRHYFQSICSLLTHPDFLRLVNKHHLQVHLALHHTLLHYDVEIPDFPDSVHLVDMQQISRHIRTSDLLITDYSSLCFDFMFLDIPVIFYHFDYLATHLNKTDTHSARYAASKDAHLYNCVYDEAAVLQRLQHYAETDFELEDDNRLKNKAVFWKKNDIRKGLYECLQALPTA